MKKTLLLLLLALLFCMQARAQGQIFNDALMVLFESQPGMRPASSYLGQAYTSNGQFDATGDDKPDLAFQREDSEGNLLGLRVLDGSTREVLVEIPDVSQALNFGAVKFEFWGFADVDGDGRRETIFTTPLSGGWPYNPGQLQAYDLNPNELSFKFALDGSLLGVIDLTEDGFEEIILFLPETRQIQVWTKAN